MERKKLLIADDSEMNRAILANMLEQDYEIRAACESAAAAVGAGEHLLHLVDARVLLDPELLGHEIEDHRREHAQRAQRQDRVK